MTDLFTALGLVLVVEGILFAAFPNGARRAMYEVARAPSDQVRIVGIVSAIVGFIVVYIVRTWFL